MLGQCRAGPHTGRVVITRRWAVFLVVAGLWNWLIWPRFGLAIWKDDRSFSNGSPTAFLWVHAVLIVASLAVGTAVGVLGVRAWRAAGGIEESTVTAVTRPKD
jgi:intracellular septation protein A